ncbi:DUF885 domain-containing protein [Nocardia transvalensis]|uniref:DUF885 domain-containing protein n=1 Tax=Nocardia transvalensis TaxID=37333 RepID=UPI0018961AD9|nr:DUF885 domain-containing protein [Nocardia transvalensis]MBF6329816.1 DUF885 domain-containing protein [Nocardia transvalensis]
MPAEQLVADYLKLGLRFGRLADGFVDCWFGDPSLAHQVVDEPRPHPADLAGQARLLNERLADTELEEPRRRFLTAQLTALECVADRLAGRPISFRAEVEAYFQVHIEPGDTDRYAEIHRAISDLLPGNESLHDRLTNFYARNHIPPERLQGSVQAVSDEFRTIVRPLFGLPDTENVTYEVVRDKPWNAFNRYHGEHRSTVQLNATAGSNIAALPIIVTHESYPGHHTHHCLKQTDLVEARGWREHTIMLVNTPQCLVSEGMGEAALSVVMGEGWGEWTAAILNGQGVHIDGPLVERMLGLVVQLLPVRQDAAILLHDNGADPDEVIEYLQRWLLLPEERAKHLVSFLTDPLWRAYTTTYIEGARLVGEWLAAGPVAQSITDRYRTLLHEPLLPADLVKDLGARAPGVGNDER